MKITCKKLFDMMLQLPTGNLLPGTVWVVEIPITPSVAPNKSTDKPQETNEIAFYVNYKGEWEIEI